MKQSIDLPEGVLHVEVLTGRIIERDGLCIYGYKTTQRKAKKKITLQPGQGIYLSRENDVPMVGYFAKEDGFKIWEMPNTACRLFAVEEAVKLGWERLDWVEEEYQERKQKKQKAA